MFVVEVVRIVKLVIVDLVLGRSEMLRVIVSRVRVCERAVVEGVVSFRDLDLVLVILVSAVDVVFVALVVESLHVL